MCLHSLNIEKIIWGFAVYYKSVNFVFGSLLFDSGLLTGFQSFKNGIFLPHKPDEWFSMFDFLWTIKIYSAY